MMRSGTWVALCIVGCTMAGAGCTSSFDWTQRYFQPARTTDQFDSELSLARLSERHGQTEQAQKIYQAVLQKDPNNQLAHHRLGVIAGRQARYSEADDHFRRAAEAAPPTAELLSDMGYCLYLQDRLDEAETTLRRAVQRDPQYKASHNNLGLVLGEKGKVDESLSTFRRVVSEAEAQSNLAYARSQMGDVPAAQERYHKALSLDGTLRPAAEALLQLASRSPATKHDSTPNKLDSIPKTAQDLSPAKSSSEARQVSFETPLRRQAARRPALPANPAITPADTNRTAAQATSPKSHTSLKSSIAPSTPASRSAALQANQPSSSSPTAENSQRRGLLPQLGVLGAALNPLRSDARPKAVAAPAWATGPARTAARAPQQESTRQVATKQPAKQKGDSADDLPPIIDAKEANRLKAMKASGARAAAEKQAALRSAHSATRAEAGNRPLGTAPWQNATWTSQDARSATPAPVVTPGAAKQMVVNPYFKPTKQGASQ